MTLLSRSKEFLNHGEISSNGILGLSPLRHSIRKKSHFKYKTAASALTEIILALYRSARSLDRELHLVKDEYHGK